MAQVHGRSAVEKAKPAQSRVSEADRDAAISAQLGVKCPESGTSGDESGTVRPDAGNKQDKSHRREKKKKRKSEEDQDSEKESGTNMPSFLVMKVPTHRRTRPEHGAHCDPGCFAYLKSQPPETVKPSARTVEPTGNAPERNHALFGWRESTPKTCPVDVWEAQVKSGRRDGALFDLAVDTVPRVKRREAFADGRMMPKPPF